MLLLALACGPEPVAPPPVRPNLVLVTLDTTRADRLGAYGYADARTPTFDALAAEGARFERAYTTVPLTIPAHSSLFTGLYPPRHGVHDNGSAALPQDLATLAEHLRAAGWATGASVGAFVTTRAWGLDQGFDAYFDAVSGQGRWSRERRAEGVVDDAIAWVGQQSGPWFLWVHLYDAHHPYEAPEPWATPGRPYDAEIAYADQQLGRLRAAVGDASWILLADHGESLGEHGEATHGALLFEPTVRIPLVVRPTGGGPGRVVDAPVSVVDVLPTALGLLGLEVPEGLDGMDLGPALRGEPLPERVLYLESWTAMYVYGFHPELALVRGPWKWMATPSPRLYDVVADPGEERDRWGEQPLPEGVLEALRRSERVAAGLSLDPEVRARLDALGYLEPVEGAAWRPVDFKDRQADVAILKGPLGDDEEALRELLARDPELAAAKRRLALVLSRQGRHEEALALHEELVAAVPDNQVGRVGLARALAAAGRPEEALEVLEGVLRVLPEDDSARSTLLAVLEASGRQQEAMARAEAWLEADPGNHALMAELGLLRARAGELEPARELLVRSLQDGVPRRGVHLALALILDERGELAAAVEQVEAELEWFPRSAEAHLLLGRARMAEQDWSEALAEFDRAAELRPEDATAHRLKAQAAFNGGDYALADQYLALALELAPGDPEVLLLQANVLDKLGRPEEAAEAFERAKAARAALIAPTAR